MLNRLVFCLSFLFLVSCSGLSAPSAPAYVSSEAGVGALSGGITGAGVGFAIGEAVGNTSTNIITNTVVGAAGGLIAGAVVHQYAEDAKADFLKKEEKIINNQERIDKLREEIFLDSVNKMRQVPLEKSINTDKSKYYQGPVSSYP